MCHSRYGYTMNPEPVNNTVKYRGDYIGMKFGHLTVIGYPVDEHGRRRGGALCRCDCGRTYEAVNIGRLFRGETYQCTACGRKAISDAVKKRHAEHPEYAHRNGTKLNPYKDERLYKVWMGMKTRCGSYGAYKDVAVCDEWLDYPTFRAWAYSHGYDENAPRGECTIDRINPFGDYEPSNCRWTDLKTQARNKRCHWLRMSKSEREEALAQARN